MKYLLIVIFTINSILIGQNHANTSFVFGNIIDAETLEPLVNANIFIANSGIGTASDNNGYFELRNLPYGRFEIIASRIGYETLKISIHNFHDQTRNMRFELNKKPIQFMEITVSAKASQKRKKQLKQFRKNFLGASQNAKETYIRNEEALRFIEENKGTLYAYAVEPLDIVNNSLGYNIKYVLDEFELTRQHVKYVGYPYFEEKTIKSHYDSIEWHKNRELTYLGSLRHFLTAICENYVATAGDTSDRITTLHFDNVSEEGVKVSYGDVTHIDEEGYNVLTVYYPLGEEKAGVRDLINTNKLLSQCENDNELCMHFENYLEVKYDNDFFPFINYRIDDKRTSWITLTCDTTIVDKKGRYFDKYAIRTKGLWSHERVADMLPFEYKIEKDKK